MEENSIKQAIKYLRTGMSLLVVFRQTRKSYKFKRFRMCPHQESNPDCILRTDPLYPLSYEGNFFGKSNLVDLARIELAPPQCECGILPLNYRPLLV